MKPVDKATFLAHLEQRVEGYIQRAVQCFQNLDEATLNRPSSTGGWSIAQCLAHLNSYGQYYLPHLKLALSHPSRKPTSATFISTWLGTYLTRRMEPQTSKTKFKAVRQHQPSDELPAHQVVAQFIDQQEELLGLLGAARTADLNQIRIPLSIASWLHLPPGDILQFMVAHTERHLEQAKRNG